MAYTLDGYLRGTEHDAVALKDMFPSDIADIDWMTALSASKEEWLIITGDDHIRRHRVERAAFRRLELRAFVLADGYRTTPMPNRCTMPIRRWADIEATFARFARPFMFKLPLGPGSKFESLSF